jgi:diadenosine tetraphosphate (Ap4A) HIT family hydrolase
VGFFTMITSCPFCDKLSRLAELPDAERVGQFPHSVVLLGLWQYYHGYCLLVSRTHAAELNHLPDDQRLAYLNDLCRLAKAVEDCFGPHKLNYELLGNQVPHLHWHLFPRYHDDPDRRQPVWLALDRAERDPADRRRLQTGPASPADIAIRLRDRLRAHADFTP